MPPPIDLEPSVDIPAWVEGLAIAAGSIAGALRGIRDHLAIPGVVALAVALGLGGGIIRDTLLQAGTPIAFTSTWFLPLVLAPILPVLLLARWISRIEWVVDGIDALGIALYSIIGADRALQYGVPAVGAVLIGVLAGTGGSILGDLIVGVPPALFRPGLLFGVASALGTTLFVVASELTERRALWFVAAVVLITALRLIALTTGWGVGPAHEISARSEALLERRLRWSQLQLQRRRRGTGQTTITTRRRRRR